MRDGNSKADTSDRRSAEVKRKQRERWRSEGFKLFHAWVHLDDAARVKAYVAKLRKKRIADDEE